MEANNKNINLEENKCEFSHSKNINQDDDEFLDSQESTPDIIEIDTNSASLDEKYKKNQQINKTNKKIEGNHINLNSIKRDDTLIIKENRQYIDSNKKKSIENEKKEYFIDFNLKEDDLHFTDNTDIENKLLVLPDSDTETENYLKEIKPKIESESFPIQETLHLTFEETFFLLYGLGCLNLIDFDGNLLDIDSAWHFFCKTDKNFIPKYVVYHYFRSKGWVVKPGLKYGGDFC